MFRTCTPSQRDRRAVILLIVVSLLTLFAVVGLSFLLYSESTARSMRAWREGQAGGRTTVTSPTGRGNTFEEPPSPQDILNQFLGQLIYDVDAPTGTTPNSVMWGNSLGRDMYSWNGVPGSSSTAGYTWAGGTPGQNANTVPFGGIGRLYDSTNPQQYGYINYPNVVNYSGAQLKPEMYGSTYVPKNAPYTYPDENHPYLAAVSPVDGKVLVPSFHRPWNLTNPTGAWYSDKNNLFVTLRPLSNYQHPTTAGVIVNPRFPPPSQNADGTFGDVENLPGKLSTAQQRFDSFWIDIDLPVRTWRGKLYKPLVAPLIIDLDGRVNVNVAGNIKGPNSTHASNQGWGGWEVNLGPILTVKATEAQMIVQSRYGTDSMPNRAVELGMPGTTPVNQLPAAAVLPPYYSMTDYDSSAATNTPTPPPSPALAGNVPLQQYYQGPRYGQNYQNGNTSELTNHPAIYNPYFVPGLTPVNSTTAGDRAFGLNDLYLLSGKFYGDDVNYKKSTLGQTAFNNFGQSFYPTSGSFPANPRFLVTPLSTDLDRVGISAWVPDYTNAMYKYAFAAGQIPQQVGGVPNEPQAVLPPMLPTGQPISSPSPSASTVTTNSDFVSTSNWSSKIASSLGAMDLNRRLADYWDTFQPAQPNQGVSATAYQAALSDRQQFAQDIFDRLVWAVGANQLYGTSPPTPGTADYEVLRFLAQLAVNIVDYIDKDDFITPFNWDPTNSGWVYGTELPRLVLNEAYAVWRNDPSDPGAPVDPNDATKGTKATKPYWVEIWAELFNPLTPGTNTGSLTYNGNAQLFVNANPVYAIGVTPDYNRAIRRVDNVLGQPDFAVQNPNPNTFPNTQNPVTNPNVFPPLVGPSGIQVQNPSGINSPTQVINPSNATVGSFSSSYQGAGGANPGFFVVGPQEPAVMANPKLTDTLPPPLTQPDGRVPNFVYTVGLEAQGTQAMQPKPPTLFLMRLACPAVPFDPRTNPYVTVDYLDAQQLQGFQVWDHRQWNASGSNLTGMVPSPVYKPYSAQASFGRSQPYAAHYSRYQPQQTPGVMGDTGINQTFWHENTSADNPYEWLTHLDRPLVTPSEVTLASAWKPHELTQQFIQAPLGMALSPQQKNLHTADWRNNNTRLYRALGLLQVRDLTYGLGFGGRIPGRVNINTIWDQSILQALCDYQVPTGLTQSPNGFNATDVSNAWIALLTARQKALNSTDSTRPQVGQGDHPILPVTAPFTQPNDPAYYAYTTNGAGVQQTIIPPSAAPGVNTSTGMFDLPNNNSNGGQPNHPYLRIELLNKLFDRLTTRSNTFAVWCTIGYFEVDTTSNNSPQPPFTATNPPWLGAELGSDDGTTVRHKFFAVIDRTNLTIDMDPTLTGAQQQRVQGPKPVFLSLEADKPGGMSGTTYTVQVPAIGSRTATDSSTGKTYTVLMGQYDGQRWELAGNSTTGTNDGSIITVDIPTNRTIGNQSVATQENVRVTSVQFFPATGGANPTPAFGTITFDTTLQVTNAAVQLNGTAATVNPHPRGTIMQINPTFPANVTVPPAKLGNPGPQPGFNYNSDRYRPVVPLVMQMN